MSDRGIIFSAPMVLALLAGRKIQTRRFCKPANEAGLTFIVPNDEHSGWFGDEEGEVRFDSGFAPGQRLWVREAWAHDAPDIETARIAYEDALSSAKYGPYYRATEVAPETLRWVSPRFMPRWASRLTLAVTDVSVQRVNDITEADAINEGMIRNPATAMNLATWSHTDGGERWGTARDAFAGLWADLHQKDGERWDDQPWVTAVSFGCELRNIDA